MRDHSAERLAMFDALNEAVSRRSELLEVIWNSDDDEAAIQAVGHLLGCDEVAAQQVLSMSWRCLTRAGRERIAVERDELRAELGRG
jgi:DNA gyrase/topoisomerase IV subunit A